jgi:hypothetical protein
LFLTPYVSGTGRTTIDLINELRRYDRCSIRCSSCRAEIGPYWDTRPLELFRHPDYVHSGLRLRISCNPEFLKDEAPKESGRTELVFVLFGAMTTLSTVV